jgi:predicted permease
MGIPVLAGRDFTAADRKGAPRAVIVSQALARLVWPDGKVLGKRLAYSADEENRPEWLEVVGVVGDVRLGQIDEEQARPAYYVPAPQSSPWGDDISVAFVVRAAAHGDAYGDSHGDPSALAGSVRQAVRGVDPRLPVFGVATLEEIRTSSFATTRFNMLLLTTLGMIGLLLAAVGIYGVIAWFVSQRTQEIGLRMALGATQGRVLAMVAWQAFRPVLVGLAVGIAGALMATRVLSGLLFGVTATDPLTFAGVLAVLAAAALLASLVPARRAARVDPTRALAP